MTTARDFIRFAPALQLCKRTLAIYRPGVPLPGVRCSYAYRGNVPCTGRQVCHLCGRDKPS